MCVVCRNMLDKNELFRLVRTEGGVVIDNTGKMQGRGAYVCKNAACIEKCVKKKLFDRAFGEKLPDGVYEKLAEEYERTKNQ